MCRKTVEVALSVTHRITTTARVPLEWGQAEVEAHKSELIAPVDWSQVRPEVEVVAVLEEGRALPFEIGDLYDITDAFGPHELGRSK